MRSVRLTTYDSTPIERVRDCFVADPSKLLTTPVIAVVDQTRGGKSVTAIITRGLGRSVRLPLVFRSHTPNSDKNARFHTVGWGSVPATGNPLNIQLQHDGSYLVLSGSREMVFHTPPYDADIFSAGLYALRQASKQDPAKNAALKDVDAMIRMINSHPLDRRATRLPQSLIGHYYALVENAVSGLGNAHLAAAVFSHLEDLMRSKPFVDKHARDADQIKEHIADLLLLASKKEHGRHATLPPVSTEDSGGGVRFRNTRSDPIGTEAVAK